MPGAKMFLLPLAAWCVVVAGTLLAFLFLEPSGDGSTRGFTFIWIGLIGFILALLLAFTAARMAKGAAGRPARLARALPMVMVFIVLVPIMLRMLVALFAPY
ncbi:hypothetical protein [Roseinatronobacter alkalisoli]|uniref:Uncharacterized protein n=1 Tax=Roseinatronobacter alkalisoli TaxID=3028235 RepID=A0ABT5TB00_9RHOB|nr:hypothetical protein [Roseinatronobacter sp. HJB301]MDD7972293.1 hypothetical protein [Roseinatronobacter sp. HJB301]